MGETAAANWTEALHALPGMRGVAMEKDEVVIYADRASLPALMLRLRDDPQFAFEQVMDICGVDWPEHAERFEVV